MLYRRCYICNKAGHVAKFCKTPNKEEEASGNLSKSDGKGRTPALPHEYPAKTHGTKQVNTRPSTDHSASGPGTAKKAQSEPSSSGVSVDPVSLLIQRVVLVWSESVTKVADRNM